MKRYLPFLIIGGVLVLVVVAGRSYLQSQRTVTTAPFAASESPRPAGQAAATPVTAGPNPSPAASAAPSVPLPTNIPAGISVTVEEFGDYQCPPCGLLHPELKKISSEYGNKVNIIFRNFPLTQNHKNALPAAQAAEAARLQGHFDQMHDRIYEHQADWKDQEDPRPTFAKYAKEIGLDLKRFESDVTSQEVQQKIEFDQQTGIARGVNGTPTVFVEGRQLKPDVTTLDGIRSGINIMLARKSGKP